MNVKLCKSVQENRQVFGCHPAHFGLLCEVFQMGWWNGEKKGCEIYVS